jgi:hypothetical protein
MTYHLRRLRLHDIIERIPKTHRHRITNPGLRILCSAPEPIAAFSVPHSRPYYRKSLHPTLRSAAASINSIRRLQLGSNTHD